MSLMFGLFVLGLCIQLGCVSQYDHETIDPDSKLIFATVIYRHGERTPRSLYPNESWNDLKFWPEGWGQLTNKGKLQQYELGTWLRNRYLGSVLNSTYHPDNIYIQSTDDDRTLMSAYVNLAAMFPPSIEEQFSPSLPWQPIPVHTIPEPMDDSILFNLPCDALEYYKNQQAKPLIKRLMEENKDLLDYIRLHSGATFNDLWDVQSIYDALSIEQSNDKRLPEWTKKVFPEGEGEFRGKFAKITAQSFEIQTLTPELIRVSFGRLLHSILERLQNKADGRLVPDRSVHVYSAHDFTMANVLNMLGLYNLRSIPYSSALLIELRRTTRNTDVVQIFLRDSTTVEPKPLNIPNCGTSCPLADMFKLYAHLLPKHDATIECKWPPVYDISE